jgi:hypothetical protein
MIEYVLILAFFSPGGDFMSKHGILQKDRTTCQQSLAVVQNQVTPLGGKVRALCVTKAHWEGKVQDKGVAFD